MFDIFFNKNYTPHIILDKAWNNQNLFSILFKLNQFSLYCTKVAIPNKGDVIRVPGIALFGHVWSHGSRAACKNSFVCAGNCIVSAIMVCPRAIPWRLVFKSKAKPSSSQYTVQFSVISQSLSDGQQTATPTGAYLITYFKTTNM